jgi:hypothetical protein
MVLEGRIVLEPYVEYHPLDAAPEVLRMAARHELSRRAILRPQ